MGFFDDFSVPAKPTSILSANELMEREGLMLQKSMNFRVGDDRLSVFLVLPNDAGTYSDVWESNAETYVFRGHDSTTVEAGGKEEHQLLMYGSGKLTENGKFYKEATAFKDGTRQEPLQIQVYEKLDPGVWFDKGIFNLVDAGHANTDGRRIFLFMLRPSDAERVDRDQMLYGERMLPAAEKAAVWERCRGRCAECGTEQGLRFIRKSGGVTLLCRRDRGEEESGGLLG